MINRPNQDHVERATILTESMGDRFFFITVENDRIVDHYSTRDAGLAIINWREAGSPDLFFGRLVYEGKIVWIQLGVTKLTGLN